MCLLTMSCANEYNRMNNLKKMFPNYKIEPATGLIKERGYEYIAIDTTGQIFAIGMMPFSETKISSFRNIR